MRSNRLMAWRESFPVSRLMARGSVAVVLAAIFSGGRATAEPIALEATQAPTPASSFILDFGPYGGVASANISRTDFSLEIDAGLGTAQFAQYQQSVDPLILPGGISTGNIHVEVVPGTSSGTLDVLTGQFNTEELYAVHFDGDLSAYHLTSPVILPSASAGTLTLSALTGGKVSMAWAGTSQLTNPFDPTTFITFNYTCAVQAAFSPEPVSLLQLALIPNVVNLDLPRGLETNLTNKLEQALNYVNAGWDRRAANTLDTFIRKVESQSGKHISDADADALVDDAEGAILLLGTNQTLGTREALAIIPDKHGNSR